MRAKESEDKQAVASGYVVDVITHEDVSQISLQTGSEYPYVVPENYVLLALNDDYGNEWYVICPEDMDVTDPGRE